MRLKNKKVLVYGLGDSGRAVVKILREHLAYVSFYDDNPQYLEYVGFERNPYDKHFDLVIISPGVKCLGNPLLESFLQRKIPVISELDFAFSLSKGTIIAITGTNGKTTVSMLTNKILKEAGYQTFLCGNIGLPFSAICEKTKKESVIVCEVSNFQLETSKIFAPHIACILNIKPDHLDRHGTFDEYVKTKAKIAQNLKRRDVLILNLDDQVARSLNLHKKEQFFTKKVLKKGVFVSNGQIYVNKNRIIGIDKIPLKGEKNLENVLASVAICSHFKVSNEDFQKAIESFSLASHRMEIVGQISGVTYVDDSKATNVSSVIACVEAFKDERIVLLMGGKSKNIDYNEFFNLDFNIKEVVCFGEDGPNIQKCATEHNYNCAIFKKFDDATLYAINQAKSGDFVLLSPACSSFDEFSSYAERGDRFKTIVLGSAK